MAVQVCIIWLCFKLNVDADGLVGVNESDNTDVMVQHFRG